MRVAWWFTLCLSRLAVASLSNTDDSSAHELLLPYLPHSSYDDASLKSAAKSYLSIIWSVQNGIVCANDDPIFPPSASMRLHAPQYRDSNEALLDDDSILSYSLDVRPLSTEGSGMAAGLMRLRVELLDLHGMPVTTNAVVVDLLRSGDGDNIIKSVGIGPGSTYRETRPVSKPRPWQMNWWSSKVDSLLSSVQSSTQNDAPPSGTANSPYAASTPYAASKSFQGDDIFSPFRSSPSPTGSDFPHHSRTWRAFVLPIALGAMAGTLAYAGGFVIGMIGMSLSARRSHRDRRHRRRRSRVPSVDNGIFVEKKRVRMPDIYETDSEEV
ncbi:hypothetical protein N7474_006316 [Penicillium riverlandense]|uniref:uncharacterized protein n=1 Tax=Penicillium riverlandense TaxID=1903569 RepID=UPI002548EDBB|nr:uncharacterized protein N7474_006316 [Penicillium riverlandense]KAJ5814539.1 hypothetical protein N7474_006316 [Penicillium riverlandense]